MGLFVRNRAGHTGVSHAGKFPEGEILAPALGDPAWEAGIEGAPS